MSRSASYLQSRMLAGSFALAMMIGALIFHNIRSSGDPVVAAVTAATDIEPQFPALPGETIPPFAFPVPPPAGAPIPVGQPTPAGTPAPAPLPAPVPATPQNMQLTISCLPELEDVCASVENVGRSAFTIENGPATVRDINRKKGPDAWLTTELEAGFVAKKRASQYSQPTLVAGSPIVVVHLPGQDPPCAVPKGCGGDQEFLFSVAYPAPGTGVELWLAAGIYDGDPTAYFSLAVKASRADDAPTTLDTFRDSKSRYFITTNAALFEKDLGDLEVTQTETTVRYVVYFRNEVPETQRQQLQFALAKQLLSKGYGDGGNDSTPSLASAKQYAEATNREQQ